MKTKTLLVFHLGFLMLHQSATHSSAATYSIKGSLTYQVYRLRAKQPPVEEKPLLREFEVQCDDLAWKVRMVLVGNTNYESFVYSYDGTNLLQYSIAANPDNALPSAWVEESPVPATETSAAGEYVWLAFASGNYLRGQTKATLSFEELRSPNGFIKRFQQPFHATLSAAPPYLPTAVNYLMTNRVTFLDTNGEPHAIPLPPAFRDSGYISAVFRVDEFKNVHGLRFPTKFEYNKYQAKVNASSTNDLSRVLTVTGLVKSISTSDGSVDCAPPRRLVVFDRRVPEPNVMYAIADGIIPAPGSDRVAGARERARKRLEQRNQ